MTVEELIDYLNDNYPNNIEIMVETDHRCIIKDPLTENHFELVTKDSFSNFSKDSEVPFLLIKV